MAFDFPATPAINDKYQTQGGPVYVWDGVAWNVDANAGATLTDYVLKAGDTMTGALNLPSANPIAALEATHKRYVDQLVASEALYQGTWKPATNVPDVTPSAAILNSYSWIATTVDPAVPEVAPAGLPGLSGVSIANSDVIIWNQALSTYEIVRSAPAGTGAFLPLAGGVMSGPIAFDGLASGPTDLSKHLTLNNDAGFNSGLSASSGVGINYIGQGTGQSHNFYVGGVHAFQVYNPGVNCYGSINVHSGGQLNHVRTADAQRILSSYAAWMLTRGGNNEGVIETWTADGGWADQMAFRTKIASPPGIYIAGDGDAASWTTRSEAALKKDIRYDVYPSMGAAFDALKPAVFKMKDQPWPPVDSEGKVKENPYPLPENRDRFGFIVDDLVTDPQLALTVSQDHTTKERSYEMAQILALTVAKIKLLEADVAKLQSKMKVITDLT